MSNTLQETIKNIEAPKVQTLTLSSGEVITVYFTTPASTKKSQMQQMHKIPPVDIPDPDDGSEKEHKN